MSYDLTDPQVLEQIVQIVESSENQNRILKHTSDYQIINGNQRQHIIDSMMRRYPESYDQMILVNLKIGEKIVRKLARVYVNGLKREVINRDTGEVNKRLTDLINYIYSDINEDGETFNDIMAKANRYYINHEYVEIFAYEDVDGRVRIKALPQHVFTAISNEEKTCAEVIVFKNTVNQLTDASAIIDYNQSPSDLNNVAVVGSYTVWSEDYNFKFLRIQGEGKDDQGNTQIVFQNVVVKDDNNPSGVNPYETMPFVAIKRPTEGHFYPYGSEIAEMSKECNVILSDLISIASQQGFGQAVIYYSSEVPPKITKTGPTHLIAIPNVDGNSKFEFANPNPDLQGHLELVLSIIRMMLTTNDLTTDKVSGELQATNFASAIDRLIADSEAIDNVEQQRSRYANVEQKLFDKILKIVEYQLMTQTLPRDYPPVTLLDIRSNNRMRVTFNSIKPMTTEKDQLDSIKLKEEMGLILPWEKHLLMNESLTIDEAKRREEEIKESKQNASMSFLLNSVSKTKEMSDDDIDNDSNDSGDDSDMEMEDEMNEETESGS